MYGDPAPPDLCLCFYATRNASQGLIVLATQTGLLTALNPFVRKAVFAWQLPYFTMKLKLGRCGMNLFDTLNGLFLAESDEGHRDLSWSNSLRPKRSLRIARRSLIEM